MTIFGYSRVSTIEQHTENQRIELESSGYKIDYFFEETISGKTCVKERKEFSKLLNQIRDGETLIVSKLDRLGRDSIDVLNTVKMLSERNIKIIVLNLGNVDLCSSSGKLLLTCLSAISEMELSLLKERTISGLNRAKSSGIRLGRRSKTTDKQKLEIINSLKIGTSIRSLSKKYNVSRQTIMNVRVNNINKV